MLDAGRRAQLCSNCNLVLARALRVVERAVGGRDELVLGRRVWEGGDAEARRDPDPLAVRREELSPREALPDALGKLLPARKIGLRKQERELLAAPAAGEVDLADALSQGLREQLQHLVSRGVTPA